MIFRTYGLSDGKREQEGTRSDEQVWKIKPTHLELKGKSDQDCKETHASLIRISNAFRATVDPPIHLSSFQAGSQAYADRGFTANNLSLLICRELKDMGKEAAQVERECVSDKGTSESSGLPIKTFVSIGASELRMSPAGIKRDSVRSLLRRNGDMLHKMQALGELDSVSLDETDTTMRSLVKSGDIENYFPLPTDQSSPISSVEEWNEFQKRGHQAPAEPDLDPDRWNCAERLVRAKKEREKTRRWASFAGQLRFSREQLSAESSTYLSSSAESPFRSPFQDMSSHACSFIWRVPEFYKDLNTPVNPDGFDNIVTITRILWGREKYGACTCISFVENCWPEFGAPILRMILRICQVLSEEENFQENNIVCGGFSINARATSVLLILEPVHVRDLPENSVPVPSGNFQMLVDCIRWICCALMPSDGKQGLFRANMVSVDSTQTYVNIFKPYNPGGDQAYNWTIMFSYACIIDLGLNAENPSVLTNGLGKVAEDEPLGLKRDFELMCELAGIERAERNDGGLVLSGFDSALAPLQEDRWPGQFRWHLWRTPGKEMVYHDPPEAIGWDDNVTDLWRFKGNVVHLC